MEYLNEATSGGNARYFFFTLLLLVIFSVLSIYKRYKHPNAPEIVLSRLKASKIDKAVIVVIVFINFWYFGSAFFKLILCVFFAYGFYTEVINPLEGFIYKYVRKGWSWISEKVKNITTLYNK